MAKLHNSIEFDSVQTPDWLLTMFNGWHDPFPLGCTEPVEPSPGDWIFANPGYSRKEDAAELCIRWHQAGHRVVMLVPIESSSKFGKRMIQYGVERLFFERRVFPNVRSVELLVLTGDGS